MEPLIIRCFRNGSLAGIAFSLCLLLSSCNDEFVRNTPSPSEINAQVEVEYTDELETDMTATDFALDNSEQDTSARVAAIPTKTTYFYFIDPVTGKQARSLIRRGFYFGSTKPVGFSDTLALTTKALKKGRVFDWSKKPTVSKSASLKVGWWMIIETGEDGELIPLIFEVLPQGKQLISSVGDGALVYNDGTGSVTINVKNGSNKTLMFDMTPTGVSILGPNGLLPAGFNVGFAYEKLHPVSETLKRPVTEAFLIENAYWSDNMLPRDGAITVPPIKILAGKTAAVKITLPL